MHAVIHMSSGDKMAPFLASEINGLGSHVIFFLCNATFIKTILTKTCTVEYVVVYVV